MKIIRSQRELANLTTLLGVRASWHEPDERGLTAETFGRKLDNAGFWPLPRYAGNGKMSSTTPLYDPERGTERYVVIYQGHDEDVNDPEPTPVAAINLADLLAWASEPR